MATNRLKPATRTSVPKKKKKKPQKPLWRRRPLWMQIIRIIGLTILTIVMILGMIGIVQRYCHILSKH